MPKTIAASNLCVFYQIGILMPKEKNWIPVINHITEAKNGKMVIRMCLSEKIKK